MPGGPAEGGAPARRAGGIPLGRVGGVALALDPLLLVLLVLVALLAHRRGDLAETLVLLAAAVVAVAVHEGAHAVAARRRGLRVSAVVLHVVPVTWIEEGAPADEWRIALAGPLANLLLGGALALAGRWAAGWEVPRDLASLLADPARLLVAANLLLGAVNLAPVLPADGGRALRAMIAAAGHPRAARRVLAACGVLAAALFAALALRTARLPASAYLAALALLLLWAGSARRRG